MPPLVIALVVLSAILHALRDFLTKRSRDKQVFVWSYLLAGLVLYLPVFIFFLVREGTGTDTALSLLLATGIVHALYYYFLSRSYDHGDLSHVYPIIRSAPALVLIFATLFLREHVSPLGVLGILTVVFGVYTINMKALTLRAFSEPIRSIFHERATQFAFLTLIAVTAYSIIDKVGVSHMHPIVFVYLMSLFAFLFASPYILIVKKPYLIRAEWRSNAVTICMNGLIALFGYGLILVAFTLERVSYVTGMRQMSIVFAVILGGHFLKEKHRFIRIVSALIIFAGIVLISVAP